MRIVIYFLIFGAIFNEILGDEKNIESKQNDKAESDSKDENNGSIISKKSTDDDTLVTRQTKSDQLVPITAPKSSYLYSNPNSGPTIGYAYSSPAQRAAYDVPNSQYLPSMIAMDARTYYDNMFQQRGLDDTPVPTSMQPIMPSYYMPTTNSVGPSQGSKSQSTFTPMASPYTSNSMVNSPSYADIPMRANQKWMGVPSLNYYQTPYADLTARKQMMMEKNSGRPILNPLYSGMPLGVKSGQTAKIGYGLPAQLSYGTYQTPTATYQATNVPAYQAPNVPAYQPLVPGYQAPAYHTPVRPYQPLAPSYQAPAYNTPVRPYQPLVQGYQAPAYNTPVRPVPINSYASPAIPCAKNIVASCQPVVTPVSCRSAY